MATVKSGVIRGTYIGSRNADDDYSLRIPENDYAYKYIKGMYALEVSWVQEANSRTLDLTVLIQFLDTYSRLEYVSNAPGKLSVNGSEYSFFMPKGKHGPGIATYPRLTQRVTLGAMESVPLWSTIKFNHLNLHPNGVYLNWIGIHKDQGVTIPWINYAIPAPPTDVSLSINTSTWVPTLTWKQSGVGTGDSAEATTAYSYDIERSSDGGSNWTTVGTVAGKSYTGGALAAGSWIFRVRSKNIAGDSGYVNSNAAGALAPLKPDLSAAKGTGSSVNLAWTNQSTALYPVSSYTIERKVNSGSFSVLASKASASTSHTDSGLTKGTNYTYKMKAHGVGDSPYSNEKTVRIPFDSPAKAAPSGSASDNDITLTWTLSPGADNPVHSIVVEKKGANNSFTDVSYSLDSSVRSFAHNDQSRGTTHTYRIRTVNTDATSYSSEVGVYVKFLPPAKPASVSVARVSHEKFKLTWTQSTSTDAPVTGFSIYRKTNGGGWVLLSDAVASSDRSYEDSTVALGTTYAYYVVAKNSDGSTGSDASNSLTNPAGIPVYNGTSYVIRPVYVFDGTNWVHRPMYVYNGSAWHWRG